MLQKIKKTLINIVVLAAICYMAFIGVKTILSPIKHVNKIAYKSRQFYEQKDKIFVDSLLFVVDSLRVQVDSLHLKSYDVYTDTVFIEKKIDTAFIINQYLKKKHYTFSHRNADLDVKINFDLYKNKIENQRLSYKILRPTSIINLSQKGKLYAGLTVGGSMAFLDQVTPEIMYTKGKHGFKLGYNLLNKNRNLQIGYYYKIN